MHQISRQGQRLSRQGQRQHSPDGRGLAPVTAGETIKKSDVGNLGPIGLRDAFLAFLQTLADGYTAEK
jgi:hypothetical protein